MPTPSRIRCAACMEGCLMIALRNAVLHRLVLYYSDSQITSFQHEDHSAFRSPVGINLDPGLHNQPTSKESNTVRWGLSMQA